MIRVVALLVALFISTPAAFAAERPEFEQTERELIAHYNQRTGEFNLPQADPAVYSQYYDSEHRLLRKYQLNPFMEMLVWYNYDGGKPVTVIVRGDQGPDSYTQKIYTRTFISTIQLFTPELGESEREALITKLGILQPDYSTLDRSQGSTGTTRFVFGANAGKILIAVSPAPKQ